MQRWSITLHGPAGAISTVETGESQFVIGTEAAADVFTVTGAEIALRHAWVWISEGGLQVEDLAGGTLVNGHKITERVQVAYPANVQVGEMTLVIELKQAVVAEEAVDVIIRQRAPAKSTSSSAVTVPQRTPTKRFSGTAKLQPPSNTSTALPNAPLSGGYTLVKEIARGGMGQIYFGEDPQLEREVAVKVSSLSEGGEDPRFSKEAKVLAHLAHPNIVPIHAIGVDSQGRPFYSMKLVKGRTLQAVLSAIRQGDAGAVKEYPRTALLTIFRKVCDAMAFAHAKGVLHRDLKPENIMVGEYGEVLVMDWGLAKVLGREETTGRPRALAKDTGEYGMTMEGEVMGTPQYMSPEQAEGMVAELDARSDIYSLGGILYAILTLRPPIDGKTLHEVLTKVKKGEISSMATKRGGEGNVTVGTPVAMGVEVPVALQAVTLKAMATDRTKRYESVEAFAVDIEAYQNGFATSAEDAGAFRQLALLIRRHKGVSAAVGLLLVAALGFTLRLAASERFARASEARALGEMEKSRRSEAEAQIVLAEAAYSAGNAEQMRLALSKVPENLRSQLWRYLDERTVGGHASALPESGSSWMGLEPHPLQKGNFLAMRSDGALCRIEGETGTVSMLWKSDAVLSNLGAFSVSKDASITAFLAQARAVKNAFQIQVRRVADGSLLRAFDLPSDRQLTMRLWISPDHLVAQLSHTSKPNTCFLSAWLLSEGRMVWELPQRSWNSFVSLAADSREIFFLNPEGFLQRIDAASGKVLAQGQTSIARGTRNFEAYDGSPDLKKFALNTLTPDRVRVFSDAWNDKLQTDFVSSFNVVSLAFLTGTDFLLTLCEVSEQAGCLEVRDFKQGGRLVQRLPFSTPKVRWDLNSLRCSGTFAALLLPNRIRIWNFGETTAERSSILLTEKGLSHSEMSPTATQVLGFRRAAGAVKTVEEISLFDVAEGWDSPKDAGRVVPDVRQGGSGFSLNGGATGIGFDRDGTRAFLKSNSVALALRIGPEGLKNLWGEPKRLLTYDTGPQRMLIHPEADLLWTGDTVVEFSTGRELRRMKRGPFRFYSAGSQIRVAWLGANHVVEECPVLYKDDERPDQYESNRLVLWNTQTGEPVADEPSPQGMCLSVSPDGGALVEGCADMRVRFRNPSTLAVEREFRVHDSKVKAVEFHPARPIFATLGATEARLWELKDGRMIEEIRLRGSVNSLRFVAGGRMLQIDGMLFQPKSCAP